MTTTGWILLFVFARLIDLVIWYFLNRGSVRANDQIAMLKEISEKQSAQIDLLITGIIRKRTIIKVQKDLQKKIIWKKQGKKLV